MEKDRLFANKRTVVTPFRFNKDVAMVFDDMLFRSVPFYGEALTQQSRLARNYYQAGTRIYDLGCSHGNMGMLILDMFGTSPFSMAAVDNSIPMLDRYRARLLDRKGDAPSVDLICASMTDIKIAKASVVIINLTLQFLPPKARDGLIRSVYEGLVPGGVLLITEKTVNSDPVLAELEQAFYCQFKRENGYSELEISQKRDALDKVLIPEPVSVHERRMREAGFSTVSLWLKWFNFASMLAVKGVDAQGTTL